MGTRSYANAIAKIIDPTSEYFGNRILSRDESGSFALKSIQRLFPCDQSMVVVIDDRADVWCWSENLIKVQPYNFFVGIGDINNTALLIEQEKNKQIEANTENENKEKEESINK
jgi:RNA polymerase II subunit A-like phosphatase